MAQDENIRGRQVFKEWYRNVWGLLDVTSREWINPTRKNVNEFNPSVGNSGTSMPDMFQLFHGN